MVKTAERLSDVIANTLWAEIVRGVHEPNTPLRESQLCKRFRASRTPVRTALRRLAVEGVVSIGPRGGAYVSPAAGDTLADLRGVRAVLECGAAGLFAARADPKLVLALEQHLAHMDMHAESLEYDQYRAENTAFHYCICSNCGNRRLFDLINGLWSRYPGLMATWDDSPGALLRSQREHYRIAEAALQGNAERCVILMRKHIKSDW